MIESVLREAGYAAVPAGTLAEARALLDAGGFAVMVLDWMLPDGSGPELCAELRAVGDSLPILMLTARAAVEERVVGLDAGADDYLKKPFAAAELVARLRALLRRGPRIVESCMMLGPIEIRVALRMVLASGRELNLTAREFDILEVLARQRGRVVTRSSLLIAVWGDDENTGESLDVLMARLRRKLAEAGAPDVIKTHRGIGYSVGMATGSTRCVGGSCSCSARSLRRPAWRLSRSRLWEARCCCVANRSKRCGRWRRSSARVFRARRRRGASGFRPERWITSRKARWRASGWS